MKNCQETSVLTHRLAREKEEEGMMERENSLLMNSSVLMVVLNFILKLDRTQMESGSFLRESKQINL